MKRGAELASASDDRLGLALAAGDPEAARVAWSRYSPMVRRILRRVLGAEHDLEDLAQDVFLAFFRQTPGLRDPLACRAYLIAISVRVGRRQLRRLAWLRGLDSTEPGQTVWLDRKTDVESEYAVIRFRRLLERVRERDRAVFVLRFVAGMKVPEIAAALGSSVPTVQRRLRRARERIELLAARDAFLADYIGGSGADAAADVRAYPS